MEKVCIRSSDYHKGQWERHPAGGFASYIQEVLPEPFSKDKQGIGLGLPLAKMIVESHNGTIEVDSTLGAGTTFTLSFLIPTKL